MGSGSWSSSAYCSYAAENSLEHSSRAVKFANLTAHVDTLTTSFNDMARTFNTKGIDKAMLKVGVRECRDSEEHPNTTPIIIAFDVTGSMGEIPDKMVTRQLPKLMDYLKQIGVTDPQLLFMAIGDHECDDYPIQVGQFESDTRKICSSLQNMYLEGGGGGNDGESYFLAWLMAGFHTETDAWFKRHQKGFLFTIGDEPDLDEIFGEDLVKHLKYEKGAKDLTAEECLEKAKEQYHVFHIHVNDGYRRFSSSWNNVLGDHVLRCNSDDINKEIGKAIHDCMENPDAASEASETNNSQYTY